MQTPTRFTQLLALIVCALMAVATLPVTAETPSEKADALLAGLIKTNGPGLAVLVAQNGKILFEKGYGLADREHDVPITPQTIFRIASITKQFTASAILKLREEGKLSVKDKLSKYIPDFPRGNEVTLRQLLNHTSGIHDYVQESYFWEHKANATTTESIIEMIKKYPYDFDPGTSWRYDNSGYLLLGTIVEKVSGQSYGDFLREKLFQPLGMTNTGVYRADLGLSHEALGYDQDTNGVTRAPTWDASWLDGAGALYSTVEDLYRWNEGIFNGRVLNAASLKAAFTSVKASNSYGFGWFIGRVRGLRDISHGGGIPGFATMLLRLPQKKFTVVVLANCNRGRPDANPERLAFQMVDIFQPDKLAPPNDVNTKVSPKSYDALTGRYDLWGRIITVSQRGTHLFFQFPDQPETEVFPKSTTEFFWKGGEDFIPITFVKDSSGKAVKIIFDYYAMEFVCPRAQDGAGAQVDPSRARPMDPSQPHTIPEPNLGSGR